MLSRIQSHVNSADTPRSKTLLGALVVLFVLGLLFGPYATNVFALTPGLTLSNYYIWTFVTSGLYDNSATMGLINIIVYAAVAPVLERNWGGFTFLKFVLVTDVCIMVSIFFSMVACYAATEYEPCLFRAVCGFSGINAAFAVALKQKFGERSCIPGVKVIELLKFNHLPMFLGWVSLILWLTGSLGGKEAPLIFFGTFFSWIYLRFFMHDGSTGVVGDLRPEFSFSTFFPDVGGVRPVVEFLGTVVFQTLFRFGLFAEAVKSNATLPTTAESASLTGNSSHSGSNSVLASAAGGANGDLYRNVDPTAERRRLLAIKAIDDKLAELARQPNNMFGGGSGLLANAAASSNGTTVTSPEATGASTSSMLNDVSLPSEAELKAMEAALGAPAATKAPTS